MANPGNCKKKRRTGGKVRRTRGNPPTPRKRPQRLGSNELEPYRPTGRYGPGGSV